jgi:ribonuclease VapC
MVINTSAIMALLLKEPDRDRIARSLALAGGAKLSAGSWIELGAVLTRRHDNLKPELDEAIETFAIVIAPATVEQARIGHDAYRRFGIGSGHPARLNFGDCFAYALAKSLDEPLLFKDEDFAQTDVTPAR